MWAGMGYSISNLRIIEKIVTIKIREGEDSTAMTMINFMFSLIESPLTSDTLNHILSIHKPQPPSHTYRAPTPHHSKSTTIIHAFERTFAR